jgi:predicted amidohydrolase
MLCEGPAGIKEAMVTCDIDLDAIATARDAMPIMGHRRPELYGSLTYS